MFWAGYFLLLLLSMNEKYDFLIKLVNNPIIEVPASWEDIRDGISKTPSNPLGRHPPVPIGLQPWHASKNFPRSRVCPANSQNQWRELNKLPPNRNDRSGSMPDKGQFQTTTLGKVANPLEGNHRWKKPGYRHRLRRHSPANQPGLFPD